MRLCLVLALTIFAATTWAAKWDAPSFCKCICFNSTNYKILSLVRPDNPLQPCLSCTKAWCQQQNLPMCYAASLGDTNADTGTSKGDIESRCFQRDSPRDQLVVSLFLLTVFGLLLGAGIKSRMVKAGFAETRLPWGDAGRRWWDSWTPGASLSRFRDRGEQYAPLNT